MIVPIIVRHDTDTDGYKALQEQGGVRVLVEYENGEKGFIYGKDARKIVTQTLQGGKVMKII